MITDTDWLPLFGGSDARRGSWRASHPQLFPSDESLRHYLRRHRDELIDAGAIVYHRGQYHATDRMAPAVYAIAQRAARRTAGDE